MIHIAGPEMTMASKVGSEVQEENWYQQNVGWSKGRKQRGVIKPNISR